MNKREQEAEQARQRWLQSELHKEAQAHEIKQRLARYSGTGRKTAKKQERRSPLTLVLWTVIALWAIVKIWKH